MSRNKTYNTIIEQDPVVSMETEPLLDTDNNNQLLCKSKKSFWTKFNLKPSLALISLPLFLHVFCSSLTLTPSAQYFMLWICGQLQTLDGTNNSNMTTTITNNNHGLFSFMPLGFTKIPSSPFDVPSFESCQAPQFAIRVQELVSTWSMIFSLCHSVPAIFTIPAISIILDGAGRTNAIKLPIISLLTGALGLLALAKMGFGMWILILTNLIQGFLGGFHLIIMVVFCYLSDCSTTKDRTATFAKIEAMIFFAFLTGPFIGGELTKVHGGPVNTFYLSMAGELIVLAYVLFVLPESLGYVPEGDITNVGLNRTSNPSHPRLESHLSTISSFKETMSILFVSRQDSMGCKQGKLSRILLVMMAFIMAVAFAGLQFSFIFYTALKFHWESEDGGRFLLVLGIGRIVSVAGILPLILKRIPETSLPTYRTRFELWIIRCGILFNLVGFIFFGLASAGWQFYVIALADSFGSVTLPMIRAVLSRSVNSHLQGRLFSAIALVETISSAFSPLVFGNLYRTSVSFMPNLIFFVIAGAYGVALLLTAGLRVKELELFDCHDDNDDEEASLEDTDLNYHESSNAALYDGTKTNDVDGIGEIEE